MSHRILLALGLTVFLLVASLAAHHSFSAVYQTKEEIKLQGKLVQFSIRNPHSFIFIEAPDAEGKMQRWSLEWGGAAQLAGQGVNQQTLKVGDLVVVTGRPSRTPGEYRALVQTISRPSDGFSWGRGRGEVVD
jgi:lysyl-tRNA synthetase class II